MRIPIAEIEEKIGYVFKDKKLLKQAFVHSSYGRTKGLEDNERMEYLGDSVLQLVVTEWQYLRDGSDEGKMTSDRQKLVCEETLLAEVHELGLEKYLLYTGKLSQNVGKKAVSSLFETLVAAIYLDGGYDVVKKFILERMADRDTTNYKGVLQELLQSRGEPLPVYEPVKYGLDNAPVYEATATALGLVGKGEGRSKKSAEQLSAKDLLEKLS